MEFQIPLARELEAVLPEFLFLDKPNPLLWPAVEVAREDNRGLSTMETMGGPPPMVDKPIPVDLLAEVPMEMEELEELGTNTAALPAVAGLALELELFLRPPMDKGLPLVR
jgi:hypothetical protein